MKIDVIACAVLETELDHYASRSPHALTFHYMPQGLHNEPVQLRDRLQARIDELATQPGDAIALGYGVCSRGADGLRAPADRPLVLARAHDCITLLLGSKQAYADYVAAHPGTYWYSPGWNRHHTPPGRERYERLLAEYTEKYGADNAEYLMQTEQAWFDTYNRATYVHLTVGATDGDKQYTRDCADWLGWQYDEVAGDPALLCDLLSGDWAVDDDGSRFLVVPPGQRIRVTADEQIVRAEPVVEAGRTR